jgi:peroxiredoxin Q/BCP
LTLSELFSFNKFLKLKVALLRTAKQPIVAMVELRKRKAPSPAPVPAKKQATTSKKAAKNKTAEPTSEKAANPASDIKADESKAAAPAVGSIINLEGFGGEFETHDGSKVTLKELVGKSESGVVLFTYPKANTPGCK